MNREVRDPYASWCERCTSASELAEAIYSIISWVHFLVVDWFSIHYTPNY